MANFPQSQVQKFLQVADPTLAYNFRRIGALSSDLVRDLSFLTQGQPGAFNLAFVRVSANTIKLTGRNATLSTTNPGYALLRSPTSPEVLVLFEVTADVSIVLDGAHWGIDTNGNLVGCLLRGLLVNDNGNLRVAVAYLGGRTSLLTTDTNATAASVTAPEHILCNVAVASASNTVFDYSYFRADFADAGNTWTIGTGVTDVVNGASPDGLVRPWNPAFTGFSVNPTIISARWTQISRKIWLTYSVGANGTSNQTFFTITGPSKAAFGTDGLLTELTDNGVAVVTPGMMTVGVGTSSISFFRDTSPAGTGWTAANAKGARIPNQCYDVGPTASFF